MAQSKAQEIPDKPGKGGETFKICLDESWLQPNDFFLDSGEKRTVRILEVYKITPWKKFLRWLGFKIPNYRVELLKFK